MNRIYLDYAATTPVDPEVLDFMKPYFLGQFGNPSSIHSFGREARAVVDGSRQAIASYLDCEPNEILFTSGGTESDNFAIRGLIAKYQISNIKYQKEGKLIPHIITTQIEHHAVLKTVKDLEKQGLVEATYLKPDKEGLVTAKQVKDSIRENTVLVSIIYVNNEIGTVQPIREIGKMIEKHNKVGTSTDLVCRSGADKNNETVKQWNNRIYFHTDAVQALEHFQMGAKLLKVDLMTITAHKIHGPKGVGVLFVKKGTPLMPILTGGEQEYKKRAGTENVPNIAGFVKAIHLNYHLKVDRGNDVEGLPELFPSLEALRQMKLRDKLIDGILKTVPGSQLNGSRGRRSPSNLNISVNNAEGEAILLNLDLAGIAASSGSACTSGALEPSHVLLAIGVPPEVAHGSIRFSLGRGTTEAEIDRVLKIFPKIVEKVRSISPFKN